MTDDPARAPLRRLVQQIEATWLDLLAAEVKAYGGIPSHVARFGTERNALSQAIHDAVLAAGEPQTMEATRLDAMVTAFEALQAQGIYLHDAFGHRLDKQEFVDAMVVAGNAVLAAGVRAPQETDR